LPKGVSQQARGSPLALTTGNPAAPAWAGADTRLPRGRQALLDLTRVKSNKKEEVLHWAIYRFKRKQDRGCFNRLKISPK
jgi:hypothetical protein